MKAASAAALVLSIIVVAHAHAAGLVFRPAIEAKIRALLSETREVRAYETAMTRYEVDLANRLKPVQGAVFIIPEMQSQVWTWFSDDQAIRRIGRGDFRITKGNCLNGFCALVDCHDAGWPLFECSDGKARRMSAPDGDTLVFGDATYRRPPGRRTADEPAMRSGETKKPAAGGGAAGFN